MGKKKSAKSLLEMNCEEVKEIIRQRRNDKDSPVTQIQFDRLARHCLGCDECNKEAREAGLLISSKS